MQEIILWDRNYIIKKEDINTRLSMYNGLKYFSILVRDNMVGYKISEFIQTKKIGPKIHRKVSKKK